MDPSFPSSGYVSDNRPGGQRALTVLLIGAAAVYFLWRVRGVLPPFLIAFFLAALLDPIVTKLERKGVSRGRAVLSIYGLVFSLIVLTGMLVGPSALNQVDSLVHNAGAYTDSLKKASDSLYLQYQGPLAKIGITKNPLTDTSGPIVRTALTALDSVKGALLGFFGQVIWLVIIPLSLFYFLMDFQHLRRKLISLAPDASQASIDTMSQEIIEVFSVYFRSLALVCVLYGITAIVLFSLLGVRYSLFLGLAAGVLYAVPYVGPAVAIAASATIALTIERAPLGMQPSVYALLVVLAFILMHVSFDYGITPRVVGGSVGLHPVANIFALMCGATLFGVWGMLLAVPVAASIQLLLLYFFPKLSGPAAPIPTDPSITVVEEPREPASVA